MSDSELVKAQEASADEVDLPDPVESYVLAQQQRLESIDTRLKEVVAELMAFECEQQSLVIRLAPPAPSLALAMEANTLGKRLGECFLAAIDNRPSASVYGQSINSKHYSHVVQKALKNWMANAR